MRGSSSRCHRAVIARADPVQVDDDRVLPAARHLTGPSARGVLRAAVEAAGGRLDRARPCHLHYQPGHDLVVRFDSTVQWASGRAVAETLVAATTVAGAPDGTLPVEAVTDDGTTLQIGVWRWPFDPVLTGLADAVTPRRAGEFLGELCDGDPQLTVLAYRPTQRAVVRAVDRGGRVYYLKSLAPKAIRRLVKRHERLAAAGLPVPLILRRDDERGLVAMSALEGPTVRERIKRGDACLPALDEYEALFAGFAAAELVSGRRAMGRVAGSLRHAAMLATVLPAERPRLERLTEPLGLAAERESARPAVTIHGDLYEAQLVTGRGRGRARTITGVLDLDDVGPGDPLGDRATVLAHLLERLVDPARRSTVVGDYVRELRRQFGAAVDAAELDNVVAAVLVGLATGPFRIRSPRWQQAAGRRLRLAERLLADPGAPTLPLGR